MPDGAARDDRASSLRARFAAELGDDRVLAADASLAFAIDGRLPEAVICPQSPAEVAAALRVANELGAAVTPWGGGTQMSLGYPLARLDVVLSLDRLGRMTGFDAADRTVTAQAGMRIADLSAALAPMQSMVPLDGPLSMRATVGGRLATSTLGLRRAAYGSPPQMVKDLLVAYGDGKLSRTTGSTSRPIAGYDLTKLMVGSLGTLGVIVEATLHATSLPESEATVVVAFDHASSIWAMQDDLYSLQHLPVALAACGPGALGADARPNSRAIEVLSPSASSLLFVRLAGPVAAVRKQALTLYMLGQKFSTTGMLMLRDDVHMALWTVLDNLPATVDLAPRESVIKVVALPSEIGTVIEATRSFCDEHALELRWLADMRAGTAWLRVAMGSEDGGVPEQFEAALLALHGLLARRWRNAVLVGCAPTLRPHFALWGTSTPSLEIVRALKSHFDPGGILNPGRLAPSK
jgi:glycolate oxidase FAD binding subunit